MGKANDKKKGHNLAEGKVRDDEMLSRSNFSLIERVFKDIIINTEDKDQTIFPSTRAVTRKTYNFKDNSRLYITERYTTGDKIDYYSYDWYDSDREIRLKFHMENHEDKDYQTETEPYHIHQPSKDGSEAHRRPNYKHKSLFEIMELIRLSIS